MSLKFFSSPTEIAGDGAVERIRLVRNEIVTQDDRQVVLSTDQAEDLGCGLVFRAIGYRGTPIPNVPFDEERGILPNRHGRALDPQGGGQAKGVYATGWYKRGPTGVIGTNKHCANETVASILEDYRNGELPASAGNLPPVEDLLPGAIGLDGVNAIEALEVRRGLLQGRPRRKVVMHDELLRIARGAKRE